MDKHRMKKKFGQNFLTDKNLLKKIVNLAEIDDKDVLEIGPGQGALTNFLVLKAKSVVAYEIDNDLKEFLIGLESKYDNLEVKFVDILEVDIPTDKTYDVVANIPYNITSPIIFKLLESKNVNSATLMVQKEVAERITAKPNTKSYNALTLIVNYYMDVKYLINVGKKMFNPVPKVDSAVFKMTRVSPRLSVEKEELFIEIVKASFHQKRKTLANNLSFSFNINKSEINEFLTMLEIDLKARAENIELEKYLEITSKWSFDR